LMFSKGKNNFIKYIDGVANSITETALILKKENIISSSPVYKLQQTIKKERAIIKQITWQ